jgi:hypothetical protein
MSTKKVSNITRTARPKATNLGKSNQVPPHGHFGTKGGGDNFKKTKNTLGVEPR